jgi:hypothetical protein
MPSPRFGVRFILSPPPDAVAIVEYAEDRGADCILTVEGRTEVAIQEAAQLIPPQMIERMGC